MYIIDGHNLIPKIPGWSLRAIDDEEKLIELLQVYARVRRRSRLEVFFDGAPPGQAGERRFGLIRAHFVSANLTADEAIRRRLADLGNRARNATVISSDRQVMLNARSVQARVITSEEFARELITAREEESLRAANARTKSAPTGRNAAPASMSPKELDDWYNLFGIDPNRADAPIEPPQPPPKPKSRRTSKGKNRGKA
jgi:uncharacterized protein